jgi:hypothetical protein
MVDLQEVLIRVTKVAGSGAITMSFGLLFQDDSWKRILGAHLGDQTFELWQLWVRLQPVA